MIRKASMLMLASIFLFFGPTEQAKAGYRLFGNIVCKGNKTMTIRNRMIRARGVAVVVRDNCTIKLVNCTISGRVGIKVSNNGTVRVFNSTITGHVALKVFKNGTVHLKNSTVTGRRASIIIRNNGDVYAKRSVIIGKIRKYNNATFHNQKGNQFSRVRKPRFVPPANYRKTRPFICKGNQDITLKNQWIRTRGIGIVVKGNCDLVLINSWIVADGIAIKTTGNGDIKIKNSFIYGGRYSVWVGGRGDVDAKNSTFQGRIKKLGNGDFNNKGGNTFQK